MGLGSHVRPRSVELWPCHVPCAIPKPTQRTTAQTQQQHYYSAVTVYSNPHKPCADPRRSEAQTTVPPPPFCFTPGCISGPGNRARMESLRDRSVRRGLCCVSQSF